MKLLSALLLLFSPLLLAEPILPASMNSGEENVFTIDALLWARPRTGADVSAMPPLRNAVQSMLDNPGSSLAIRYPGGDDGGLWAQELYDWLVSLGIEPAQMSMQPGSAFDDRIELKVIKR